jgi:hypothetical protein
VVVAVLAVVLLPAVPVSALTFLTPWSVTQKQKKGAPAAVVTPDFMGAGSLLVDMGRATTRGASSSVSATRSFHVGPGSETIDFMHTFETFLKDASLQVSVKFKGFKVPKIPTTKFSGDAVGTTFPFTTDLLSALPEGDYTAKIKLKYKNKNGEWDNTPPSPGSPHTFKVTSI